MKLNKDNYEQILKQNKISVLFFNTTRCILCQRMFNELKLLKDINIYVIDIDTESEMIDIFDIKRIPYILLVDNNVNIIKSYHTTTFKEIQNTVNNFLNEKTN